MRHIDHVVVAVRDLDGAADLYARLGFQVGPRNRHPWGTENRIIQFRHSFIELIAVPANADIPPHAPGHFSFGAFVRDYLQRRAGLAMLVLSSVDAAADAARFAQEGIGDFSPFRFERTGRRPDGSATHVAFSLAFAVDSQAPDLGFFTCQQHFPEAFWNESLQRHPNGATAITGVTIAAPRPQDHGGFLSAFTGSPTAEPMQVPLAGGAITVRPGTAPAFLGFNVLVPELGPVARSLRASGIAVAEQAGEIVVEPDVLHGVRLTFVCQPTSQT
ncbi:VOC family protein [Paracoccus sediminis]|uniref:Glyoxalase-like domain-containing protein n=2 Tax=Paracoccus sediminis TaxID=1214787 RepID=A0A238YA88_9RHOB|nr:VOC family protein [Paracoccus sediminis]SNR67940.1 Glyoxalase-like domain-containing protein [Paracoccus sediminis]